jgi:AraC-like DNA-binding protein
VSGATRARARPRAQPEWIGQLFFGPGRLTYAGRVGETNLHAHHTFQLVLAVDGVITLGDARGETIGCRTAIVPPNTEHAVLSPSKAILVHVAADDRWGRHLRTIVEIGAPPSQWKRAGASIVRVRPPSLPLTWEDNESLVGALCATLPDIAKPPRPVHPAVQRVLRLLPRSLDEDVRLDALAAQAGISAGRLSHLFRTEVGTALRPYILWLRMQRVAECLGRGDSLTSAAHAAGFADSAHLSHVFRRMFGLAPSEVMGTVEWVLPPAATK